MLKSKEGVIAPATSWDTCQHTEKKQVAATFWGDATVIVPPVNFRFSKSKSHTVAPFTFKVAKQKVEVREGRHCISHILGQFPTHKKTAGRCDFLGWCNCNFFTSKFPIFTIFTSRKTHCGALYSKARQTNRCSPRRMPLHQPHTGTFANTQKKTAGR